MSTCITCGAELVVDTCPHCPLEVDPTAPTIPIPAHVLRERFRESGWPPPHPPLDSELLDDDEPVPESVPTRPQTPDAMKKRSDPPRQP